MALFGVFLILFTCKMFKKKQIQNINYLIFAQVVTFVTKVQFC